MIAFQFAMDSHRKKGSRRSQGVRSTWRSRSSASAGDNPSSRCAEQLASPGHHSNSDPAVEDGDTDARQEARPRQREHRASQRPHRAEAEPGERERRADRVGVALPYAELAGLEPHRLRDQGRREGRPGDGEAQINPNGAARSRSSAAPFRRRSDQIFDRHEAADQQYEENYCEKAEPLLDEAADHGAELP